MSDFIGIDITGIDELLALMRELPEAVADGGVEEANKYTRGVLQRYPPYKYVSRANAYPETGDGFFSDKQRRWFFWALKNGRIDTPYSRTNRLSNAWKLLGAGRYQIIVNETPYAQYVMGDDEQSRHEGMAGWKKLQYIVEERFQQILHAFELGVTRAIRKKRG